MKTFTAIILNIIYPGTGYLYLKDSFRRQIAIFLVAIWTLFLVSTVYLIIKSLITNDPYIFSSPMEVPILATILWAYMSVDTYLLAAKKYSRKST